MLNPIDTALQIATPTMMVPRHEGFEPIKHNGHRFLVASSGLWLEARREWLYLRCQLASQTAVAMPYGSLNQVIEIRKAPRDLLHDFVKYAKKHCPLECAAWVVWNSATDIWRLVELPATVARNDYVSFDRPALEEKEHLVVDLHSHARISAFFSSTDNKDDRGEFKVSGVFGKVDTDVEATFRLCANGHFIDLGSNWEGK